MPTWDDRINDAARELTEGSSSADLKARIIAAIEEPAPRLVRGRSWMLAPAAAALTVVAIVVLRNEPSAPLPGTPSDIALEPSPPALSSGGSLSELWRRADAGTEGRLKSDATAEVRLRPEATMEVRLEPEAAIVIGTDGPILDVADPAALVIPALAVNQIEVEELPPPDLLALDELSIDPIEVRPLTDQ
jgi:hypothetical protein